ncbi:MAG: hypothetical protein ACRD3W_23025, partial [Terriglobales bacterium]
CAMSGCQLTDLVEFVRAHFGAADVSAIALIATDAAEAKLAGCTTQFVVGQSVFDIRTRMHEICTALPQEHRYIVENACIGDTRYGREVVTALVMPHMVPNNTSIWLHRLYTEWIGLPAAHSEKCVVKTAA